MSDATLVSQRQCPASQYLCRLNQNGLIWWNVYFIIRLSFTIYFVTILIQNHTVTILHLRIELKDIYTPYPSSLDFRNI